MRKNGKSLVQGQLSTMGKAMKAMKSPKLKGILKEQKQVGKNKSKAVKMPKGMKKPSAALAFPNNDEGLSLEEKMEKFHEKEGKSVDEFIGMG